MVPAGKLREVVFGSNCTACTQRRFQAQKTFALNAMWTTNLSFIYWALQRGLGGVGILADAVQHSWATHEQITVRFSLTVVRFTVSVSAVY